MAKKINYEPSRDLTPTEAAVDNAREEARISKLPKRRFQQKEVEWSDQEVKVLIRHINKPWNTIYING